MNNRPTTTVTVDNSVIVEALTGSAHPKSYLDNFPEEVYNTSSDSRLYKLLYTLLGPTGVAILKSNYFNARLKFEENGLILDKLDQFYGNPFRFVRSLDELYLDNWKGLLTQDSWDKLRVLDESYRKRIMDYFHAARLGGTPEGMHFASRSALGYDTQIVEGYKYLFNQHSDFVTNYRTASVRNIDGTYNLEEFTVVPNDTSVEESKQIELKELDLLTKALDHLKPVNTLPTTNFGQSCVINVPIKNVLSSSELNQVTQFITGNTSIPWIDNSKLNDVFKSIYWIKSGIEKEAPKDRADFQQHYQHFHKPSSIVASSQAYGQFNPYFTKKFAILESANNLFSSNPASTTWKPENALANYPNELVVTGKNQYTNKNIINYIYPADYLNLKNVPVIQNQYIKFWASAEAASGDEYLIIDLGSVKAINFIMFEALGLPIKIQIQYDCKGLINSNNKIQTEYKNITIDNMYPTNDTLVYDANNLNKWNNLAYVFSDQKEDMIFTRYIKINFTRLNTTSLNQSQFLLDQSVYPAIQRPWSIVIKNLRLGRNVV